MSVETKHEYEFEALADIHLFYPVANNLVPVFRKLGVTPNMITTLSLISTIYAFMKLNTNKNEAIVAYLLGYLFDTMDGAMARKYKMGSEFGMTYDMVTDTVSNILILYLMFTKEELPMEIKILLVVLILALMMYNGLIEAQCSFRDDGHDNFYKTKYEIYKNSNSFMTKLYLKIEKSNYDFYKKFMPKYNDKKVKSMLKNLKIVGPGNFCLIMVYLMYKYF